jgi:hypothetical protein
MLSDFLLLSVLGGGEGHQDDLISQRRMMANRERPTRQRAGVSQSDQQIELKLRRLLKRFEASHARTLDQLDRTDAALDRALANFQRP